MSDVRVIELQVEKSCPILRLMAKRLSRIFLFFSFFLFLNFFSEKAALAAVLVEITSYPSSVRVGEEFDVSVKVDDLSTGQVFRAKVGIAAKESDYYGHGYVLGLENDWVGYNESGSWGKVPVFSFSSESSIFSLKAVLLASDKSMAEHLGENRLRVKVCFAESIEECSKSRKTTTSKDASLTVIEDNMPPSDGATNPNPTPPADPDAELQNECVSGISLSEFMANPPTDGQEWVEIYNSTSVTLDLSGWQIDDIEGASAPRVFDVLGFKPASYYAIYFTSSKLNDGGDSVRLLCPDGSVLETFAFKKATDGWSWAKSDGSVWKETSTPTPNGKNVVTVPKNDEPKGSNDEDDEETPVAAKIGVTAPESSGGEITPEAASDYRPENPPKWRVGEVEAEATEATSPIGRMLEASASTMVNLSKGMMMSGGLVTLFSLILYVFKLKKY